MDSYKEGMKLIEESCGNGKDNVIALATMALDLSKNGHPYPNVREVDAYYEDGVFYITTWGESNKILQIAENNEVAFVVCQEGISGYGRGENLGWVLDPKNADIRNKLRKAFSLWYDHANNETDKNCVIMAIHINQCTIFRDEGATQYKIDMVNKKAI